VTQPPETVADVLDVFRRECARQQNNLVAFGNLSSDTDLRGVPLMGQRTWEALIRWVESLA
jgi:hypothetical protein